MKADNPDCKIELKTFHSEIINDHEALRREEESYVEIPVVRKLDDAMIQQNFAQIRRDVQEIIYTEMERLLHDPALKHLVVKHLVVKKKKSDSFGLVYKGFTSEYFYDNFEQGFGS
jgi:hypothetical protein